MRISHTDILCLTTVESLYDQFLGILMNGELSLTRCGLDVWYTVRVMKTVYYLCKRKKQMLKYTTMR